MSRRALILTNPSSRDVEYEEEFPRSVQEDGSLSFKQDPNRISLSAIAGHPIAPEAGLEERWQSRARRALGILSELETLADLRNEVVHSFRGCLQEDIIEAYSASKLVEDLRTPSARRWTATSPSTPSSSWRGS